MRREVVRQDPRLGALPASIPPLGALWLSRQAPDILRAAAHFERNGRPDVGADLRVAVDQLRRSAAQVRDDVVLPRIGNAEAVKSEMEAESETVGPPGKTLTVAETAAMINRTPRRVVQLIGDGVHGEIRAAQHGRGTSWEVDRQSVLDYLMGRSSR